MDVGHVKVHMTVKYIYKEQRKRSSHSARMEGEVPQGDHKVPESQQCPTHLHLTLKMLLSKC